MTLSASLDFPVPELASKPSAKWPLRWLKAYVTPGELGGHAQPCMAGNALSDLLVTELVGLISAHF